MELTLIQILLLLGAAIDQDIDDSEIYLRIKNGDQKAFKTFFENHHDELFRYLKQKGVAKEAAEDLIQKAFIYIWENRAGIDETKSLRAYLFRIAYTRMLNLFRDHSKFDKNQEVPDVAEANSAADEDINRKELNQTIENAISAMPDKRQEVFRLCFLQEFTYKEAAETLQVSVKTIENHMGLALKDLRSSLSQVAKDYL
ncbi:RNA polymerase sigma factor [Gracilimonas sp. Q87]|uniref:RNA polymerase sigma factor n=1 Tax=Gracilimonas sp. Q87 TaxID=3384766 RepID=UPI0039840685